jgi:hypothetical protein
MRNPGTQLTPSALASGRASMIMSRPKYQAPPNVYAQPRREHFTHALPAQSEACRDPATDQRELFACRRRSGIRAPSPRGCPDVSDSTLDPPWCLRECLFTAARVHFPGVDAKTCDLSPDRAAIHRLCPAPRVGGRVTRISLGRGARAGMERAYLVLPTTGARPNEDNPRSRRSFRRGSTKAGAMSGFTSTSSCRLVATLQRARRWPAPTRGLASQRRTGPNCRREPSCSSFRRPRRALRKFVR